MIGKRLRSLPFIFANDNYTLRRAYPKVENRQLIADFHFTVSCSKDIFDFLIEA